MKKSVFGLVDNQAQANRIIDRLSTEHFQTENVSMLAYDRDNRLTRKNADGTYNVNTEGFGERAHASHQDVGHEKHTKAPEGAATGATAGGVIGGALGLMAGLGALAIPGVGPFIAAGPILAALSGSAIGGAAGLLVGGLAGLGIPEYEAKKLEKGLKEGHILVSIGVRNDEEIERAKKVMQQEGAKDVSTVSE